MADDGDAKRISGQSGERPGLVISGRRFVVPFVAVILFTLAVFLVIQFSGQNASRRNFEILSFTAALKDIEDGYYQEAIEKLTPVIESGALPEAWAWRGEAYYRLEDYERAAADFRQAVATEPDSAVNVAALGFALGHLGQNEAALKQLDKAEAMMEQSPPPPPEVRRTGDTLTAVIAYRRELRTPEN